MGSGVGDSTSSVLAITSYNGNVISAGFLSSSNGHEVDNIGLWNGSIWTSLGAEIHGYVIALAVYNGELYAGGKFDSAGGVLVNNIVKWNGTVWSAVDGGVLPNSTQGYGINALAVHNGALYVGGQFHSAGGISVSNIAKWNGSSWAVVGGGIGDTIAFVRGLFDFEGKLYAGGGFLSAGPVTAWNIASWNDTSWSAVGGGISFDAEVVTFNGSDGILYAGGSFGQAGGTLVQNIAKWDGSSWSDLGGGVDGYIASISIFNGTLLVAGAYHNAGGDTIYALAQWHDSVWSTFAGGVGGNDATPLAMDIINGNLYIAGTFTQAGSTLANNIAEYTCASNIKEVSANELVHVFPNPTNGRVNFSVENLEATRTIQIYNLLGQRIHQSNLNNGKNEIDLIGEANGTYLYRIYGGNGEYIASGSFVIQ